MDKDTKMCNRCKERDGIHEMLVTARGMLGPLHKIYYCDPCYQYLKQEWEKNNVCHGWGCECHDRTVVVGPPPQPLEIPATLPIPRIVGDPPLPDIRSILSANPLLRTQDE